MMIFKLIDNKEGFWILGSVAKNIASRFNVDAKNPIIINK